MVKSSASVATATAFGEIGENPTPPMDAGNFRQRWQTILDSLCAFEELTGQGVPQAKEEAGLAPNAASGPASATELQGRNERDANGLSAASSRMTRSSDLTAASLRNTLYTLLPRVLSRSSDTDQTPPNTGLHDSTFRPKKWFGGNDGLAKTETATNSSTTAPATNPEYAVALTVMPPPVLPSRAGEQSGRASFVPEVQDPLLRPTGGPSDNPPASTINGRFDTEVGRTTSAAVPDAEHDDNPSLADCPSPLASRLSRCETGDADQRISPGQENSAAARAAQSTASPHSRFSASDEQSALGSGFPNQTSYLPDASRDTALEQISSAEAHGVDTLSPEIPQRDHTSVREVPATSKSKLAAGIFPIDVGASSPRSEDAHGKLIAAAPTAVIVQFPDSVRTASDPHPTAPPEPFVTIDAGDNTAAKWVLAAGHRAEAGFQDPSLGWVSVRAQAGAGGIHAALIPSSDVAAQVLGGHLAGLNAHMANQYEHLNPVTLSTSDAGWQSRDTGREMAQENGENTRHGGDQQPMHDDPAPARIEPVAHSAQSVREEPQPGAQMQTADAYPRDGHVSFIV